ncbi:MAG: ATP-binding protein [Coleofasciculus sp. B1-GNL1-01]|uniref:sensor histidine kinase n=1 Tax=Coleofasciculus sp. B1-GNL1-01 TaxID=3068484 RepID=UPI003301C5C8
MVSLQDFYPELCVLPQFETANLTLDSTIRELNLYHFQVESVQPGRDVAQSFQLNPLLPGVILTQHRKLIGMISRRQFLEQMSSPYGLELFLKRPLHSLYRFVNADVLILRGDTKIVDAARRSLQRTPKFVYEPIIVELESGTYRLLDVHQLLVAQSQIQELTTQLLHDQTQAQMIQTEKMASLGQMVAGIAHEIKNPVACITGNFEFLDDYCDKLIELLTAYAAEVPQLSEDLSQLKEDYELDFILEDLPKILKSMKLGSERLTKIVGSLQNFSHMDESRHQPANIHECIESTLIILTNRLKKGINIIKNYANLPLVNCSSGQLSQVFMNLISNAIDALNEKSEKAGNGSGSWQPQIEINTRLVQQDKRDWVLVKISDNGSGIAPDIQERIFETFFTTKPVGKGTGLGLAITHQIVTEKHDGKLLMQSQLGKGTTFEILLPLE